MSEDWANRQRHTNRLARKIAHYIFQLDDVTPKQLHGLSKLSWITNSYQGDNASYIASTKIPALESIFGRDYKSQSIAEVADDISTIIDDSSIASMVRQHTGFTNFYKAYRNSSLHWVESNFSKLLPMYKAAYFANNPNDRVKLTRSISKIPGIPKANKPEQLMNPAFLLTPTFFMLDKKIRYPIITGNKSVKNLLKMLKVEGSDILSQYSAMIKLYDKGGIADAADLDQLGNDLPEFLQTTAKKSKKSLLKPKNTSNQAELSLKDEADIDVIRRSGSKKQRRIHNQLTNNLLSALSSYTLMEGRDSTCMFDVLVKDYNQQQDLLIEVKSTPEIPNIRMAIGQLYNYWFELKGNSEAHIAILLPSPPNKECVSFLSWIDIGLMWFDNNELRTSTAWLKHLESAN